MPMEMVARAKGSPIMRPALKDERPPLLLLYPFSILRREGEPREPYEGMWSGPDGSVKGILRGAGKSQVVV